MRLILDAPFYQKEFRGRWAAEAETLPMDGVLRSLLENPRHEVYASSEIGEGCLELEEFENGLFTHYLLDGLSGSAERDQNGRVTWKEAFDLAQRYTVAHARFEGREQTPSAHSARAMDNVGEEVGNR